MKLRTFLMLVLAVALAFPLVVHCNEKETDTVGKQKILLNAPGDWARQGQKPIMEIPDGIFSVSNQVHFFCTHTFKLQPGKKFSFYAEVRSDDEIKGPLHAAVVLCDKTRKHIPAMCCVVAPGDTMTQLVQPTTEKQNFIIVKNNPKWLELYKQGFGVVAFNARQDLSDLPNSNYSTKITDITPDEENLRVTFEKELYEEFPAGTNVRLHKTSGFYKTIEYVFPNKEWRKIGGVIEAPANIEYFFPCIIYYGPEEKRIQIRNLQMIVE
ncbi:MAG: hypothetical protein IKP00_17235 [Victivallales bacterium]|nr:hypothetical protein [Victivallales bacterium]